MKKESEYQSNLIKRLKNEFKDCIIIKNDPTYLQGIPDLTIFYKDKWATLEVKKFKEAKHQPNQDYYVDKMNSMSFSAFIYPENEEEVMNRLRKFLHSKHTI